MNLPYFEVIFDPHDHSLTLLLPAAQFLKDQDAQALALHLFKILESQKGRQATDRTLLEIHDRILFECNQLRNAERLVRFCHSWIYEPDRTIVSVAWRTS